MTKHRLQLRRVTGLFAVCRFDPAAPVPDWAWRTEGFVSITRTADEWSVVCAQDAVPEDARCERGWSLLQVSGTLDFSLTGVMASIAVPLGDAAISMFAISTYDTDYVLVRADRLEDAARALETAGHTVA